MTDDQFNAFLVAAAALWFFVIIAISWDPGQKHCRCCPNYRKKGGPS